MASLTQQLRQPGLSTADRNRLLALRSLAPGSEVAPLVAITESWPDGSAAQGAAGRGTPLDEWWPGGSAPMLVIQGLQDKIAPPGNGRDLKANYPDRVTLVEIDGAGHAALVEHPARIADETVAFLRKHPVGRTELAQNPRDRHILGPETFASRTVASGLDNPWDIAWGPDDHLWITERTGFRITRLDPATGTKRVALVLDDVYQSVVQDGLLGLALHPDLLRGRGRDWVFVSSTYDRDPGPDVERRIRVRRYTYDSASQALKAPIDVIDNVPAHDDHGAGRLAIGPDGHLYFSRGDLGSNFLTNYCNPIRSQDLPSADDVRARDWSTYQGKILRLRLDGSIPDDNPMFAGVRSHIYAIGLRNTQGMVFGPGGLLYASDHGPSTDDELNLIVAGRNYGWPRVAGYRDDRAYVYANWSQSTPTPCRSLKFDSVRAPASVPQSKESEWNDAAFAPPLTTFFTVAADYDFATLGTATIAPGGIDVYTAPAIPNWANSILITGMRGGGLYRVKLGPDGRTVVGEPARIFPEREPLPRCRREPGRPAHLPEHRQLWNDRRRDRGKDEPAGQPRRGAGVHLHRANRPLTRGSGIGDRGSGIGDRDRDGRLYRSEAAARRCGLRSSRRTPHRETGCRS